MSHPRESATQSSSPSKSSLNRAQGPRSLLPSPHFELPLRSSRNEEAIEASVEGPIKDFQPFFTLIENPSTSEHHHPTVHYIFADDDVEIITEAACRALAQDDPQHVSEEEDKLPAPVDGIREHYVLLDVQPDEAGYTVTKAHSLSSEWQVKKASISNAPTIDGTDAEFEGLMLKIEGIGSMAQMEPEDSATRKETLLQMVERFEKGLAEIRKMVDEDQIEGGI
jgi:hypothetical protein